MTKGRNGNETMLQRSTRLIAPDIRANLAAGTGQTRRVKLASSACLRLSRACDASRRQMHLAGRNIVIILGE